MIKSRVIIFQVVAFDGYRGFFAQRNSVWMRVAIANLITDKICNGVGIIAALKKRAKLTFAVSFNFSVGKFGILNYVRINVQRFVKIFCQRQHSYVQRIIAGGRENFC